MKLVDFLEKTSWTRSDVARRLGLSRGALTKWDDIPEKWLPTLQGSLSSRELPPEIVKRFDPKDISDLELLKIMRNRSKISDWDLCQERGWRVWEFNQMLADLVKKYPPTDEFWKHGGSES